MSKTLIVSNGGPRASRVVQTASVVTVRRRRSRRSQQPSGGKQLKSYAATLNDPYEFGGVPLGYDLFIPTALATAYARTSFTVNATDGSFSVTFQPEVGGILTYYNGVKGNARSTAYVGVPAANSTYFTNNMAEARVVSGGMRLFCLFPETSAPGALFAGTSVDYSKQGYSNVTTQNLCDLPASHLGVGTAGASITCRPVDNDSFAIYNYPIVGYAASAIPFMTTGYIAGLGFPAGTVVWVEAVLNIEGTASTSSTSGLPPVDETPATLASSFPTPGQLWTSVQSYLSGPVVMDAAYALGGAALGGRQGLLSAARNIASRHMFGRGSNTMSANRFALRAGRESTVMIEEMKEESGSSAGYVSIGPSHIYEPSRRR